jgi:hypothetical protein
MQLVFINKFLSQPDRVALQSSSAHKYKHVETQICALARNIHPQNTADKFTFLSGELFAHPGNFLFLLADLLKDYPDVSFLDPWLPTGG